MDVTKYSTYDIRVRAIKAYLNGMSIADVAKAYQTHRSTVHRWLVRYKNENGEQGLRRKPCSGRPRKTNNINEVDLKSIVLKPASSFGYETDFWTCKRLLQVLNEKFEIKISRWTVWRRLREAGLTYQKPERKYFEANEEDRQKWIENELPIIISTVKKYKAILYFEDESNISMTSLLGKTWAPRGKTPVQQVTGKRGGIAAISAISKRGDLIFKLLEKRIVSEDIINFLDQMLKHHKRRHLVVVMDKARPHTSLKTKAFIEKQKRLHVFYLPSYSPDWNPDEKVWNHLKNQELKSHQAKTKEEIKKLAEQKLTKMASNPHQMRGIFFRCFVADLLH